MNMEGAEIEVIAEPMQIPRFAIFFIEKNIKLIVISDPNLEKTFSFSVQKLRIW